jgi:hypothetical protein
VADAEVSWTRTTCTRLLEGSMFKEPSTFITYLRY